MVVEWMQTLRFEELSGCKPFPLFNILVSQNNQNDLLKIHTIKKNLSLWKSLVVLGLIKHSSD